MDDDALEMDAAGGPLPKEDGDVAAWDTSGIHVPGATIVAPVASARDHVPGATIVAPVEPEHLPGATIVAPLDATDLDTESGLPAASTSKRRAAPAPLHKGARLGRWVLDQVLGEGATATVWSAHHEKLGAPVAIKVFHRHDLPFHTVLGEARAAAGIPSPNVIWVYDADTFDGHHAIVMELCAHGSTIAQSLRELDEPSPRDAAALVAQAARGVQAAHEGLVFHKDIKPANVLRNPSDGRAQITDFGLANPALWARKHKLPVSHTAQSTVCIETHPPQRGGADDRLGPLRGSLRLGTPEFMAPEQAAGLRRDLDPKDPFDRRHLVAIDVYGLGATLYHLLAGRPPYPFDLAPGRETDPIAIMDQVRDAPPPPITKAAPGVDRRLARIVEHAMERDPLLRYPSAEALADDLEAWLSDHPTSVDTSALVRTGVHLYRERVRVGLLAALTMVTVGSSLLVYNNAQRIAAQTVELSEQRDELAVLEAAHSRAEASLATTSQTLEVAREELVQKDGLLDATGKELEESERRLSVTARQLASTSEQLSTTSEQLAAARDEAARLGDALEAEQAQLAQVQAKVTSLEATRAELDTALARARATLVSTTTELEDVRERLASSEGRAGTLAVQVDALTADARRQAERVASMERSEATLRNELATLRAAAEEGRVAIAQLRQENQELRRMLANSVPATPTTQPTP